MSQATSSHSAKRHDLASFDLSDMIQCGRAVRRVAESASSMEAAAREIVRWLHLNLVDANTGKPNCALVRCFKTHRFGHLPPDLDTIARGILVSPEPDPQMPVLTLLGTAGDHPDWNDRRGSTGHAAIPLQSVEFVQRAPMIAALLQQMGLDIGAAMYPTAELILDAEQRTFNVFHVPEAVGDPRIPAQQQFVIPNAIRSVLGFGGLLPSGELFAIIMFSRTPIPRDTADLFRTIALGVKLALLPYARRPPFETSNPSLDTSVARPFVASARSFSFGESEEDQLRSEISTLQLLIPALEEAALYQTERLKKAYMVLQRREEEVRLEGERLASMLEATSDAVFLLDRDWRFTFLNRHAITLIAQGRDLLNVNLLEAFPYAEGTDFMVQYRKVMGQRIPVHFQEYYPDPLNKWFEVHASPSQEGIAVFFHDITERLKTDASLRQAEKLSASGRMAASIAHEINNPLEAVTNLLYFSPPTKTLTTESKSYVNEAESELRRVSEITTHMLRFYRQSTNATAVALHEVIDSVLILFQGRLTRANVTFEKRFTSTRSLHGFAGELRQVFANLVGNAIDASPEGGRLLLRIRDARHPLDGSEGIRVTVADTGTGMSRKTSSQIFEPFFTTKGITGTGLGLWVSLELIQKHRGTVHIKSSQDPARHGTVFSLFFPL